MTRSEENAQKSVESRNFQARKNVLEYDDVMNTQREVIYAQRQKVLDGENLKDNMMNMLRDFLSSTVADGLSEHGGVGEPAAVREIVAKLSGIYFPRDSYKIPEGTVSAQELTDSLFAAASAAYESKEARYTSPVMRELERVVTLRVVD